MSELRSAVRQEAEKLIRRHESYLRGLSEELNRRRKRSGDLLEKKILIPRYWSLDAGFDPYHVRSQSSSIAYAIERAIQKRDYKPRAAVSFHVPKECGGIRTVSVFQVADNAISRAVFKQLLAKNSSRLSARCYAYRNDLTLHDAILDIADDIKGKSRLFVAEFDFRKFFDSISHEHIWKSLSDNRLFITETERYIVDVFLKAPTEDLQSYNPNCSAVRKCGIPQGTSVSLFLANVAARPLDKLIERLGVGFARFADDTVVWSDDYSKVCRAVDIMHEAAEKMGVGINFEKSPGINILAPKETATEFRSKPSIDFLGYNVSSSRISMRESSISKIKSRISYLIYSNLLEAPKQTKFVESRVAHPIDRDYVVAIQQIRRYLYGDLSESDLRRFLARDVTKIEYRGLLSFYPIIDDDKLLRELDGWLLHTIFTTLRLRTNMFEEANFTQLPVPHGLSKEKLLRLSVNQIGKEKIDLRIPSFARMSKLLRKAANAHGANVVANPSTLYGMRRSKEYSLIF